MLELGVAIRVAAPLPHERERGSQQMAMVDHDADPPRAMLPDFAPSPQGAAFVRPERAAAQVSGRPT